MRILVITPWYPTIGSPVAGVFVRRDTELISTDHDVELVHLVDPSLLSEADLAADSRSAYPVHRVPMSPSRPTDLIAAWRRIRDLIPGFDVVHTHAFRALPPFLGHRVRKPWVHSEHWSGIGDPDSLTPRGRLVLRLTGPILRRPEIVTAVSNHLLSQVKRFRSGPTMVVPSVVADAAPAGRTGQDPATLRLVSVGQLSDGKDPMLAVRTVEELRRRGVKTTLDWVGDGPLRPQIESLTEDDDGITLHGALDSTGVTTALNAADVFLLPTRGETLCLSALEAISHGRPVVIGSRGGQRDYITDDNGRLVDARTPEAYADAVVDIRQHLDRLDPESVAATLRGRFSAAAVLAGYEHAYERAIDIHRKARR
ncbi:MULTISPECIES: glycosyltransferase [unclassified Microbacterium]|uniref:glycosyltransferase n=1 Tax=unclassified Microbacterium TaxID=2609290 RepID=UPI000EA94AB0|nr:MULTISPECIES: glycosyltransferase [unclassified Microbacterium]MBT2485399.1 glycosyltransferase [Microbacterium sp. ISL-108]RKN68202.1 glycosyltransferase [Microbacterium sp. CGR2]